MKKYSYIALLLLVTLVATGCRSNQETVQTPVDTTGGQQGGSVVADVDSPLPSNDAGLGALLAGERIQVEQPESFVNVEANYLDVQQVDVNDWAEYFNETYQLAFSAPTDYVIFEDEEGDIQLTGHGPGDFFIILVGLKGDFSNPLRTSTVLLNGQEYTIEEHERDGVSQLSYVTVRNGQQFRFLFEFNESDEFIDLFNRVMQTVRFF